MNKQNNLGRFILVLVIIAWALLEVYPPTSRDLVQEFSRRAVNQDAAFKKIVEQTHALQQGGTSFLVEMDTNVLFSADTNSIQQPRSELTSAALSQAIEVLRKRIDKFGVAEPPIQSAGGNRILIQLPGLSQSDKDSAKSTIQKTAFLEFRMVHDNS